VKSRLGKAGLLSHVAPVAAHIDPSTGEGDNFTLQVLAPLTEAQQEQLVELMRPASFTLDMRRLTHPPR
jgi:hypothetical protein